MENQHATQPQSTTTPAGAPTERPRVNWELWKTLQDKSGNVVKIQKLALFAPRFEIVIGCLDKVGKPAPFFPATNVEDGKVVCRTIDTAGLVDLIKEAEHYIKEEVDANEAARQAQQQRQQQRRPPQATQPGGPDQHRHTGKTARKREAARNRVAR